MKSILIVGSSGHAKVIIDIVEKEGHYQIAGLLNKSGLRDERVLGYPVLGRVEDLPRLMSELSSDGILVAVGDNFARARVAGEVHALCPDLAFVRAVDPTATLGREVALGEGTVIMAGVTVNPCCSIGSHCILNTNASLDHDSQMLDFSSLAPNVAIGGDVQIGAFTAVGIGATLIHGIRIGEHTVIGAGATVLKDIPAHQVAYGTPARVMRKRAEGETYL